MLSCLVCVWDIVFMRSSHYPTPLTAIWASLNSASFDMCILRMFGINITRMNVESRMQLCWARSSYLIVSKKKKPNTHSALSPHIYTEPKRQRDNCCGFAIRHHHWPSAPSAFACGVEYVKVSKRIINVIYIHFTHLERDQGSSKNFHCGRGFG